MLAPGADIWVQNIENADVAIYTITGQLVDTYVIDSNNNQLFAPSNAGVYVLKLTTDNKNFVYKIKVQ